MKKFFVSTFSALVLMLALTTNAFAAPAVVTEQARFKGTLQSVEIGVFNPGPPVTVAVTATGSGKASVLGRFTYSYTVTIFLNPDNSGVGTLYYTFVAANGDRLYSTGQGVGTPVPTMSGFNHVVEKHTITGGTGRFAGASGSFTVDRLIGPGTPGNISSGTFDGTIILAEDN